MANRLANESSPYLLQHKDNPVDWYPWGEEALALAQREDRPILLSVGYSACHWCHVMEHESFADAEVAAVMNDLFVNVKVDREERPDVDALYMRAVQQISGHGGWPMTVFLTPDGSPFYGGTYFPPRPKHGLPSFRQVLEAVHLAYRERRDEVDRAAGEIREALERGMAVNPDPERIDETYLHRAYHGLARHFDRELGGLGGAPKFPQPMVLDFLLRYWARTGSDDALLIVRETLVAMSRGGIHDHVGGGFHRYSVDARWFAPHFEKMLYDNALLSRVYARAAQATGEPEFRSVAEGTLDYLLKEMRHEAGGFFSSQDADSEGEEGRFYVWTEDEIDDVVGAEAGALVRAYYGVTAAGNWEGRNILYTPLSLEEVAAEAGTGVRHMGDVVRRARPALYEARARREWPGRDDKVLTSWNALALQAFAEAGRIFHREDYVQAAIDNARFLLAELRTGDTLHRSWRDGTAKIHGFLEDHALLLDALLELYRTTFELYWLREARSIADRMIELFWSPVDEIFHDTAAGRGDLIVRPRDIHDNATPSGSSAAAQGLTRLARLTGEPEYERIAGRVVSGLADLASRIPRGFSHMLGALSAQLAPPTEIAIVGNSFAPATRALLNVIDRHFLPETTVVLRSPATPISEAVSAIPLLAGRDAIDGKPTAFVCQGFVCRLPVTTAVDLETELDHVFAGIRSGA